jgi:hypothetical protein
MRAVSLCSNAKMFASLVPCPVGLGLPRSTSQRGSPLSMCVEQQAAQARSPLFAALVRPFRAPNLTGSWRKDTGASQSLVRLLCCRALHA